MTRYDAWLDRPVETTAWLNPWPTQALMATLGQAAGAMPANDGELPCLWHWLYFLETADRGRIGFDGHPQRGDFLPPIPYSRRMFAGGRTRVLRPLRLGAEASLTRRVTAIEEKRPGPQGLFLITVLHEYRQDGVGCVREERDFAYLNAPTAPTGGGTTPPPHTLWRSEVTPDPMMLMRFSALTFNSHRIHYDTNYAVQEEGYPERVTHGPLTAILLAELARREGRRAITDFNFRARSPLFVNRPIILGGTPDHDGGVALTAYDGSGVLAMSANAVFAA